MTTYNNKDKLFTIAVAAGQCTRDGDMTKAIHNLNIIASLMTDEDKAAAAKIAKDLQEAEGNIKGVKEFISGHAMELEHPDAEPDHLIDISKFTHEEALFMLVVLLGGNMRGIANSADDRVEREKAARNVNELLNMIARTITQEDWEKAGEMSRRDRDDDDPSDPFKSFSA